MSEKINKSQWQKGHTPWNKGKNAISRLTDSEMQAIFDYYAAGNTMQQCADKLNISLYAVFKVLHDSKKSRCSSSYFVGKKRDPEVGNKISRARMGHSVNQKTREAVSKANKARTVEQRKTQVTKAWITKKINNTYNTSKVEEDFYKKLLKELPNKTIYRQYKDSRYPFNCDFYILEDDLFIELNAHWTHGAKLFDENDPECMEKLALWKEKAKVSKFYNQAIYVWTDLDVRKYNTAIKNNLNFKFIYE